MSIQTTKLPNRECIHTQLNTIELACMIIETVNKPNLRVMLAAVFILFNLYLHFLAIPLTTV